MRDEQAPRYDIASVTAAGGRCVNEDTLWYACEGGALLALVADGLGGQGAGDRASRTVAQVVAQRLWTGHQVPPDALVPALQTANRALLDIQRAEGLQLMSTAVLLSIAGGHYALAHVGDSRGYVFRARQLAHQTADHSASQLAVLAGEITPGEIRHHPDRSRVLRAVGGQESLGAELAQGDVAVGDAFLLCSDGFWEWVTEAEMAMDLYKVTSAQGWLDQMMARLGPRIGPEADNLTAIAVLCR